MLINSPWYFSHAWDNITMYDPFANSAPQRIPSTNPSSVWGRAIDAGASNVDGTAVTLFYNDALVSKTLPFDCHYLVISLSNMAFSTDNGQVLLDILVDRAGGTSWSTLISDLACGFTAAIGTTAAMPVFFHFPIWIPAGSMLGAQARTRGGGTSGRIFAWVYGTPSRPDAWWCGTAVESLGVDASISQGTDLTYPGSANNWGSWTNVGSTTSARYGAIQLGINGTDAASAAIAYHFEVGYGSQRAPGTHFLNKYMSLNESGAGLFNGPMWCDIPAGSQMQARRIDSGTSGETINVAIYGVY